MLVLFARTAFLLYAMSIAEQNPLCGFSV